MSIRLHLHRIFCFYTDIFCLRLEDLVLLSFRGYLDEIESENKSLGFFIYFFFFMYLRCGVRGIASNFQVLIRRSGGGRPFRIIVGFLAGQASSDLLSQMESTAGRNVPTERLYSRTCAKQVGVLCISVVLRFIFNQTWLLVIQQTTAAALLCSV